MNKWIGWVEDNQGYMVRFIGPTSRAWANRKAKAACEAITTPASWTPASWTASEVDYAMRNRFAGHTITDRWFRRLNGEDRNLLITVMEGWK